MSAKELSDLLKARMRKLALTNSDIAKKANISRQTWYKLINAEIEEAKLSTLINLASALDLNPLTLLQTYFRGHNFRPHQKFQAITQAPNETGFISDITYPDNSIVYVGEEFEKVWEIVNLGKKPWLNWRLVCVDDKVEVHTKQQDFMIGISDNPRRGLIPLVDSIPIPPTQPGEHVQLKVWFRAPLEPCTVISYWKSVDAAGNLMFPKKTGLYCQVKVMALS